MNVSNSGNIAVKLWNMQLEKSTTIFRVAKAGSATWVIVEERLKVEAEAL